MLERDLGYVLRLVETGINEGKSGLSLERNPVLDVRLGPNTSQPPGSSWQGLA